MEYIKNIQTIKPIDFDTKWQKWLQEVQDVKNEIKVVSEVETSYGKEIKFYFLSVKNTFIYAILYLNLKEDKPVISYYHGHNSHIEQDFNIWHCMNLVNAGYSVVAIDMRFQSDKVIDHNEYRFKDYPSACYNIDDLDQSYTLRLDQDALKIIDIIQDETCFKALKNKDIYVAGPSQGGGLSLMVASFCQDIKCCIVDVPSDCALKNRVLGRYGKYQVIDDFLQEHEALKEEVLNSLDYFDVINMASNITCPVIASVGLLDNICPKDFFLVAYEKIKAPKELYKYEFGHGGFEEIHLPIKIKFMDEIYKKSH